MVAAQRTLTELTVLIYNTRRGESGRIPFFPSGIDLLAKQRVFLQ